MRKLACAMLMTWGWSLISACSNQQVYNALQGARENECVKIVDATKRAQCMNDAHKPYNQFEQQRNESRTQ